MTQDLKPLTSMRFFAAFWVVLFAWWPRSDLGATPALFHNGYLGVDLFFVLSGFILCHVYLQQAGERRFKYGAFLWNRLARIYPLHLAVIAGLAVLAAGASLAGLAFDPNVTSLSALPANLLMVHAWGVTDVAGWNHPSWSISAEWFAYLTFPIFAAAAWGLNKRPWVAVGLAVAALFAANAGYKALTGELLTEATIAGGFLRIVPSFAYGSALYLLWRSNALNDFRLAWGILGASVVGVVAAGSMDAPDVLIVALFGPLILSLAALTDAPKNPLASRPFVYLGEISYSVYMVCVPWQLLSVNAVSKLLDIESKQIPLWAWLPLVLAIVPLAAASYHLIEKPARQWLKGFAARPRREETTPQVA